MRWVCVALLALLFASPAHATADKWYITKDHWNAADEIGFGKFVQSIGDDICSSTESCMRSAANPYRASDPTGFDIDADCAKFVYFLRAYYAWKHGLPFSFVNGIAGKGADLRFSKDGNRATSRYAFLDHGDGIDGPAAMRAVLSSVSSATYRQAADKEGRIQPDFYSPALSPQTIKPGTVIYDVNGHAAIVYRVDADGRIHYFGASPDFSIARDVYGAQFGQPPASLGGGFKDWRPQRLVGAHRDAQGHLIGGHIELDRDADISSYSLVQYTGTGDAAPEKPTAAKFAYNGVDLGYFEYVRAAVSGGDMSYNPIYEFKTTLREMCKEFGDRAQSVDQAIADGTQNKPHPDRLPGNIYASPDGTWESYATPMRDGRIKAIFAQSYRDLSGMLKLWQRRDPRIVYDGLDLQADLRKVYRQETRHCGVTYLSSAKVPVTLNFDDLVHRLYAMSFDPYDCIEHRWGETGDAAASCPDADNKRRWYRAEQVLRNQVTPDVTAPMNYTLAALERLNARPAKAPAPVDVKTLIDDMGPRIAFQPMQPIGE
ncbi:MAG: hypothetical protein WBQ17_17500 [Rhizomicrobium sp.]